MRDPCGVKVLQTEHEEKGNHEIYLTTVYASFNLLTILHINDTSLTFTGSSSSSPSHLSEMMAVATGVGTGGSKSSASVIRKMGFTRTKSNQFLGSHSNEIVIKPVSKYSTGNVNV